MSERTRRLAALGSALAIAAGLSWSCGTSRPPRERHREVILRSEDVDRKVGDEASTDVRSELGLIEDPVLTEYVRAIGSRLARHAPRRRFQYQFQIVDQEAPNAFALPGGYIYVSRGLLLLTNSEDELANVIGHEIVHVAARHAAARQAAGLDLPSGLNWLQGRYLAGYGRTQEQEADRLGQGLAAVAGYDPNGLAVFLRELEHTERLRLGASRLPSFWATHPLTSQRVSEASARARMATWRREEPIAATRADYLRKIEGLAVGTRAAEGVLIGERFFHAGLDLALRFPPGWETRNTHVAVGAFPPQRDAQVFLEHQGPGDNVQFAAADYVETITPDGFRVDETQPIRIGEYEAFRVRGRVPGGFGQNITVMLTFIQRDGVIYRITGAAPSGVFRRYRGAMLNVARSFRPLKPGEREQIQETRLRVATARGGETLAALSERTSNTWDIQQTAIMNAVRVDHVLEPGELVKIAVAESYRPPEATDVSALQ